MGVVVRIGDGDVVLDGRGVVLGIRVGETNGVTFDPRQAKHAYPDGS